jgi:hypothetical protein
MMNNSSNSPEKYDKNELVEGIGARVYFLDRGLELLSESAERLIAQNQPASVVDLAESRGRRQQQAGGNIVNAVSQEEMASEARQIAEQEAA